MFPSFLSADGKSETFLKRKHLLELYHFFLIVIPAFAPKPSTKYSPHPEYSSLWHPLLIPLSGDFKSTLPRKYSFRENQDHKQAMVSLQCSPGAHSGASGLLAIGEIICDFMMRQLHGKKSWIKTSLSAMFDINKPGTPSSAVWVLVFCRCFLYMCACKHTLRYVWAMCRLERALFRELSSSCYQTDMRKWMLHYIQASIHHQDIHWYVSSV